MPQYDNYHINRCDAMEFLASNFNPFPDRMPETVRQAADGISEAIFKGWRFVVLESGELVFANCLSPCIRGEDIKDLTFI